MTKTRKGDEINLIDSSLYSVSGTSVSTSLYVVSGIIYTLVTDVSTAGIYMFIIIGVSLFTRPIRGVSQALHKIGSEQNESVASYFSITLISGVIYFLLFSVILVLINDIVQQISIYETRLLLPVIGIAGIQILSGISTDLMSASGYPGFVSWIRGLSDFIKYFILIVFADLIVTVSDIVLIYVVLGLIIHTSVILYFRVILTKPTRREIKRVWNYAKWSSPNQVFDRFTYNMPSYVLGVVASPVAVGIYESADRFADFGATISWNLSKPILSKVSGEWSVDPDSAQTYLNSSVTGGIGITFLVFGYILSSFDTLSNLAFSDHQQVFAYTIILVGGVNIIRGLWTILSHVMKGVNRPDVSLKTKVAGVITGLPVMIVLGLEYGALGGAVGYVVMNLTIGSLMIWYVYDEFGRVIIDTKLIGLYCLATTVSAVTTGIFMQFFSPTVATTLIGLMVCVSIFFSVMYITSQKTRKVTKRVYELATQGMR